jgi:signal transduction histidine kinase
MSLYSKILWLFVCVAILPLLIFAGVARQQTLDMADVAAEAQLVSVVATAGRVLEQEAAAAEADLRAFADLFASDPTPGFLDRVLASGAGPRPEGFHWLAVQEGEATRASAGEQSSGATCAAGIRSSDVRVTVPFGDEGATLVGAYRPGRGGTLPVGPDLWVYDVGGEVVVATSCLSGPGLPDDGLVADGEASLVDLPAAEDGAAGFLAVADVSTRDWIVVARGSNALRAPLAGFFRDYWLFVLGLAGTTLLGFSVFVRSLTGALDDLTLAVERVASGDLRPWFPTPRNDEIGRLTLAFQEMTERLRDMVSHVDRSSRLAVLGKLSAYLAHEIRNPLSSVKMNLQRLERWRKAGEIPDRYGEAIDVSLREVGRLSAAVSNVLQLTPSKTRHREVVGVHEIIHEVGRLLDRDFARRSVRLRWDLNAEADRVLGEPGPLKGVIINLMLNALDAQPAGGSLHIESALCAGTPKAPGPRLVLRFADSGPGVPSEVRDKIFDPFFTTKESGSGIGLAVASQTIRNHGGDLYLAEPTRVGQGAEFVIDLPLAAVVQDGASEIAGARMAPWMEAPAESEVHE